MGACGGISHGISFLTPFFVSFFDAAAPHDVPHLSSSATAATSGIESASKFLVLEASGDVEVLPFLPSFPLLFFSFSSLSFSSASSFSFLSLSSASSCSFLSFSSISSFSLASFTSRSFFSFSFFLLSLEGRPAQLAKSSSTISFFSSASGAVVRSGSITLPFFPFLSLSLSFLVLPQISNEEVSGTSGTGGGGGGASSPFEPVLASEFRLFFLSFFLSVPKLLVQSSSAATLAASITDFDPMAGIGSSSTSVIRLFLPFLPFVDPERIRLGFSSTDGSGSTGLVSSTASFLFFLFSFVEPKAPHAVSISGSCASSMILSTSFSDSPKMFDFLAFFLSLLSFLPKAAHSSMGSGSGSFVDCSSVLSMSFLPFFLTSFLVNVPQPISVSASGSGATVNAGSSLISSFLPFFGNVVIVDSTAFSGSFFPFLVFLSSILLHEPKPMSKAASGS